MNRETGRSADKGRCLPGLGHFIDSIVEAARNPYAGDDSGWYMHTGEGAAVAAGAEDLEGVDLDEALSDFNSRLAAVIEASRSGVGEDGRFLQAPQLPATPEA